MSDYKLSVDLGPLLGANSAIAEAIFPLVSQAVEAVAEEGAFRWKQAIMKAKLWQGEKAPYVESISWKMVNPFEAEISTDYKLAGEIETGRPAKDLKKMLLTSKKVRVTKSGTRYLIIPFRHNTPGNDALAPAMPDGVYSAAKALSPSYVVGSGLRVSGQANPSLLARWSKVGASRVARGAGPAGMLVHQAKYAWGDRLPAGMAPKLKPHHKTDPYAGMVRFDTSAGKAKSSSYLIFRVMSEKSSGWIVGPRPGLYLAKEVADSLQGVLDEAVGQAVTLKALRL